MLVNISSQIDNKRLYDTVKHKSVTVLGQKGRERTVAASGTCSLIMTALTLAKKVGQTDRRRDTELLLYT